MKNFKDVLNSSKIVCAFLGSTEPNPGYSEILDRVKSIQESLGIQSKVFVPNTKIDLVKWYSTLFEDITFESTDHDSLYDVLIEQSKTNREVIVVAESAKQVLFEEYDFVGVDTKITDLPKNFKEFSTLFEGTLEYPSIKELYQELHPIKNYKQFSNSINEQREKFYSGETFKLGSIVEDSDGVYEIINRGSNYVQVVDHAGVLSKKFISTLEESTKNIDYGNSYFKGVTPSKKFLSNAVVKEAFDATIQDYNKGDFDDSYAIIKSINLVDEYLNENTTNIMSALVSIENIGQLENHQYLFEMVNDSKLQAAQIIAGAFNVKYASSNPADIVNQTILVAKKSGSKTQQNILNKMLALVDKVGIKYNKKLLESTDDLMLALHKNRKLLKEKPTKDVLKDHQDMRKLGVEYTARDVGGKRAMIDDILSHNHGVRTLKSYKQIKAQIRKAMDESYGSDRAAEFAWQSGHKEQTSKALDKSVYALKDKKTNKVVSYHKSTMDALAARKKLRGSSDTHSIVKEDKVGVDLLSPEEENDETLRLKKIKYLLHPE